jgi:glutamate synthase (NADPH/NADH) small chain
MEKHLINRRAVQMEAEGVQFRTSVNVGVDVKTEELRKEFDAIVLAGGATHARDLPIPGRNLKGIYQAMHFLPMANRYALGNGIEERDGVHVKNTPPYGDPNETVPYIHAKDKHVVIVGGGDTGADCLGTSRRQGAVSIAQFEIVPRPPDTRAEDNPWPQFLMTLPNRSQPAHDEGCDREFQISTKEFIGDEDGHVKALKTVRVEMEIQNGRPTFVEVPGSEQIWEAELVLLALGFLGPERNGMLEELGVELTRQGNVQSDVNRMTSVPGVFTAGDMTRGQSLIVWAIAEGRQAAAGVDRYLMGESDLPRPLDLGNDQRPFI